MSLHRPVADEREVGRAVQRSAASSTDGSACAIPWVPAKVTRKRSSRTAEAVRRIARAVDEELRQRAVRDQRRRRRRVADAVDVLAERPRHRDDRRRRAVEHPLDSLGDARLPAGRDLQQARRRRRPEVAHVEHERRAVHPRDRQPGDAGEQRRRRRRRRRRRGRPAARRPWPGPCTRDRTRAASSASSRDSCCTQTRSTRYGFERSSSSDAPAVLRRDDARADGSGTRRSPSPRGRARRGTRRTPASATASRRPRAGSTARRERSAAGAAPSQSASPEAPAPEAPACARLRPRSRALEQRRGRGRRRRGRAAEPSSARAPTRLRRRAAREAPGSSASRREPVGDGVDVARRNDEPGDAVRDDVAHAADVGRDDRLAARPAPRSPSPACPRSPT